MFETAGFQNVLDTASVVRKTFIRTKSSVFSNDILYSYLDNQTLISLIAKYALQLMKTPIISCII